jgi:hypothetical protein
VDKSEGAGLKAGGVAVEGWVVRLACGMYVFGADEVSLAWGRRTNVEGRMERVLVSRGQGRYGC